MTKVMMTCPECGWRAGVPEGWSTKAASREDAQDAERYRSAKDRIEQLEGALQHK